MPSFSGSVEASSSSSSFSSSLPASRVSSTNSSQCINFRVVHRRIDCYLWATYIRFHSRYRSRSQCQYPHRRQCEECLKALIPSQSATQQRAGAQKKEMQAYLQQNRFGKALECVIKSELKMGACRMSFLTSVLPECVKIIKSISILRHIR
ncbi:hypothetical protein EON65_47100 [archaeon]|nr:MAG: hypothetical protein EON65_47100 [archaeon]